MKKVRARRFFSSLLHPVALLSCIPLLLLFTGCGGMAPANAGGGTTTPTPTVTIGANPTSIAPGGTATLTVTATNATQVTVTGTNGSSRTLPATGGTVSVTPTTTTTFTATATGAGGNASATATVTIGSAPTPTVSILASPLSIAAGGSSVLTVVAINATAVTITGTDGSTYNLQSDGGTQSVTPAKTTTYTATATGADGTITATATVTVVPPVTPTVTITAAPTSIALGSSAILTVVATNATTVTVTGTDGSKYTLQPSGGMPSVSPTATTTYTATATGPGGTATATVILTVVVTNPPPTVTLIANPISITAGSSSLLTVSAKNAATVTITGTDGSNYTLQATGGTQAVSPATSTTYTATVTGPGGTANATATLTVTPNPVPTVTMTASPASVVSGTPSTLTVTTTNATLVTITGTDGSSYTLASTSGTQAVTPTATTTYTATATGPGGTTTATASVTVTQTPAPTVTITANPTSIVAGNPSTLTVVATNAATVTITGTDGSSYTLAATGGTQSVTPTATTTYTATATATGTVGSATATTTVAITAPGSINSVDHVIFMMQENHSFDNYFGMLNPYRVANGYNVGANGTTYTVDGIDDKLTISNTNDAGTVFPLFKFASTCVDDMSSAWLESFGDVNTYDFAATRPILTNGFVHNAEGYATSCAASGSCSGAFTDTAGQRAMGYYDQGFLNYYYYMASQFALSDRWFSPVASKTIDNRIATFTGGTTQGLVKDPGSDDHLPNQLVIPTIFQELDAANVTWKVYYTVTQGFCLEEDDCPGGPSAAYPATNFSSLSYSYQYLHGNTAANPCKAPTVESSAVGDTTNSFCIDLSHIAPIAQYYTDLTNGTLPSFAFIEAGYGNNDEHPGSGQSILTGQAEMAKVINAFMVSPEWKDSIFFFSYDEGGGPYDHVPPVPGSTNLNTDASQVANYPNDISTIAVNPDETGPDETGPDEYNPCVPVTPPGTPTLHCDLASGEPGAVSTDAAANPDNLATGRGFASQLGFRVPNMIISPFTISHYVSHTPIDHTAVIKFVENRFIGPNEHLTARDAIMPNLLDFFNFTNPPWATPPTPPTPNSTAGTCTPTSMGPS